MTEPSPAYFEHEADIGVIGHGATLAAAIADAARATFAVMTDLEQVEPRLHVAFSIDESDPEFALVTLLNRLLAEARLHGAVFGRFAVEGDGGHWRVEAWGEPWRDALPRGTEVKGATLTMLKVSKTDTGWEARCVVDV